MNRQELDPCDRITTGAVGEPGQRTFYLQARKDDVLVTLLMEKQQVALLAAHVDELLDRIGVPDLGHPDPDTLDLEQPIEPTFRIGRIGLGYDEDRDMVLLQCDEFVAEDEDPDPEDVGQLRLWVTRGQVAALARRGERAVEAGRPVCTMCGNPVEPDGHFCPRSNGHGEVGRLV